MIPPRRLRAVAATLTRRRHRARVEHLATPAEKTLGLSEQLARRPGKRCRMLGFSTSGLLNEPRIFCCTPGVLTENSESIEKSGDLFCPAVVSRACCAFISELLSWLAGRFRNRAELVFVVVSASFQLLYVMIILAHDRRRIVRFDVTEHPRQSGFHSR